MKRTVSRFYRWWRALNHQGMVDSSFEGYGKNKRAEAVGLLIAAAPMLPLMLSDTMGLERGWLWYGWSAVAVVWAASIVAIIIYQTGKSLVRYYRARRLGRR